MKILVTGGAGFIGSHLVDKLVEMGNNVFVLDNLEEQVHTKKPEYLNPKAEYLFGDIRDKRVLKKAIEGAEVIFHEAAAVGVGQSMYQVEKYVDVNTMATAKLLDLLVNGENEVRKLIVASSMSIYGEGAYECEDCGIVYPKLRSEEQLKSRKWEMKCSNCGKIVKAIPTSEDKPLHPTSIYAITKRDQEEMCLNIGRAYGVPTVALRYFNVYGPRQSLNNPYTGVCAIFSSRIKNNNPPLIFEDGLQSRDFVSVHDIVEANILAMKKLSADYEVFNVGTGKSTNILEIAHTLIKLYGKELKPQIINKYRAGDIRHCFADISRIKNELGFEPKVAFEEGITELVDWGEKEEAVDKFEKAHEELKAKGLVEE
ncbi:MAG: SDR family NAD(P)-dependent oxidoreductase [Methanocellales archaeon]|nr:SDR family NAD(P)-dependent oxidoreductase [Methanocellales archaeon]MDD3291881.1 SDR family NAD(P)-dependent oxidoreductase [Methanocellales archaeon]MDD5235524.1 SDR family NAD(P)-dependent oxidoreductase [Methanocellales archaeon]MDD5485143.1 SDR family NAD(P)-dependent oxidoreductase [Methanocellales archaeon]